MDHKDIPTRLTEPDAKFRVGIFFDEIANDAVILRQKTEYLIINCSASALREPSNGMAEKTQRPRMLLCIYSSCIVKTTIKER